MRPTVHDIIWRYWICNHGVEPLRWSQSGGGSTMTAGGHPLTYHVTRSKQTVFTVKTGDPYSPCSVLELDFASNKAVLQIVNHETDCFADGYENMRTVVWAAYAYAKRKGMRELHLTDISTIFCPEPIPLADLSFLTTGRTWYESIIPGLFCVTPDLAIAALRQKAHAATWAAVGADLAPTVDISDPTAPGSAMRVLEGLKKGRGHCSFFSQNMTMMVARSYGRSLQHTSWKCVIPQGSQPRRYTARRRNTSTFFTRSARLNRVFRTETQPN